MATDFLYVGSSPAEEPCAQIGQDGFYEQNVAECRAYIRQIRRVYGNEPEGAQLTTKTEHHDFGVYREVVVKFDPYNPDAVEYAFRVEEGSNLGFWDKEAKEELKQYLDPMPSMFLSQRL